MKFIPRFYGNVEEGKLKMHERDSFLSYLSSLEGKVEVLVYPWRQRRSLKQNDYFHAYVRLVCEETGDVEVEQMKEWLKDELGEKETVTRFGKEKQVPKSTTLYTRKEMADFITRIEVLTGIPAPDSQKFKVIE